VVFGSGGVRIVQDCGESVAVGFAQFYIALDDEVKRHFQELVFNTVIQRNVKLSEAPSYGLPTILYDADSTGAKNHIALAKELISHNED
jgi:cellulose biosynthesis protein BcsQ